MLVQGLSFTEKSWIWKLLQKDHESQRQHNAELVRMQEESCTRKEKAKIATEEQIQAQQRQTEKERAELERETIRVKAMAEAEGRAHEAKLTEEQNRRMLLDRINGEREKWLAAINTTFSHIEGTWTWTSSIYAPLRRFIHFLLCLDSLVFPLFFRFPRLFWNLVTF